jgi:cellulose synthase/poly-beta-1,6-N-acetylglucosamine synthase-like glycosyltransferase
VLNIPLIVFATLVVSAAVQAWLTFWFIAALLRFRRPLPTDDQCPKAAIVLCLRGRDPFLDKCLAALLQQDYPDYRLHVVIDRADDPARGAVDQAVQQWGSRLDVQVLTERRATCSLKCSSLVQAVRGLDESVEVVALVDADSAPHATWLRELVAPLRSEQVGATTGNRWYMPQRAGWGAMFRYLWNAAAIVQMYWYRIAWGGTLAVKTRVIRDLNLLDRWGNALCEDTMLLSELGRAGLRVEFVPSLIMVNREDCDLVPCLRWISRQLLVARLYHPGWPLVAWHGILTTLLLGTALGGTVAAVVMGDTVGAAWLGGALLLYQAAMILLLSPLEWAVRRIVRARGESAAWLGGGALRVLLALPLTQVLYPVALALAMTAQRTTWRKVVYEIGPRREIKRLNDPPYAENEKDAERDQSL